MANWQPLMSWFNAILVGLGGLCASNRAFGYAANVTSDEDVWAAIQGASYSFRHPLGTVAIGKALDSNWRLKGLKGIRVVDSSTFPSPPTCHPQADVYALAHRAAQDIRAADGGLHS
ncbi:hypothetical protein VTN77DRAFT_3158 [Rasamsonia byssochlamydoides]|uniref:uncharacterized protein n=1 Tax=Rasamsonia byssochlamydoides TaxID=89139 RepID=UPI0037439862